LTLVDGVGEGEREGLADLEATRLSEGVSDMPRLGDRDEVPLVLAVREGETDGDAVAESGRQEKGVDWQFDWPTHPVCVPTPVGVPI
jgi:hypothetical protein